MKTKEDRFTFTAHALERGLERMLEIHKPHTQKQFDNIKLLILKSMQWNDLDCKWVLPDYGLELVMRDDKCVTLSPKDGKSSDEFHGLKPITDFQKRYNKKYMKLGRSRNRNNKDKKGNEGGY